MEKVLLLIGAVLVTIFPQSDATVQLPSATAIFQQGRDYQLSCFVTGEEFVAWVTPAKPARPGVPAIPSKRITEAQPIARKRINNVGDNYQLYIKKVTADDGGLYQCVGASNSSTVTVSVDINLGNESPLNVRLGRKDIIRLDVSSYPAPTYTWSKDGQALTFDSRRTLDRYTGNIVLNPVIQSDEGNYSCTVRYGIQQQPHNFPVFVVVIPRISKPQGDPVRRQGTVGYNITFRCDIISGTPEPKITWYVSWDGTNQPINSLYDSRWSHPTMEEFTITGIQQQDKNKYRCIAENAAGKDELRFEITEVSVAPMIEIMVSHSEPKEGDNVKIQCKVPASPTPKVAWYKNGQRFGDTKYPEGGKVVAEISFPNIQWSDGGMYTCQASNGAVDGHNQEIQVEETVAINVISPPKLISPPDNVYTFIGNRKNTSILCEFSGYPEPMVKMTNDNGTVVAEGNGSALFVIPGTYTDEFFGEYNCSAVNRIGRKNTLLSLLVATKPEVPRNVVVETTCKDISLTWQKPINDGGLPITNYVISLLSSSDQTLRRMNVDASLRETKISKEIKPETAYKVSVLARNDAGYGDNKTVPAQTKKFCVPGKPQITNREKEIESSFTLTWLRPTDDGGDNNIKYQVEWGKRPITDETEHSVEENIPDTSHKIENLEHGAEYEFRVKATNQAGAGEPDIKFFLVKQSTDEPTQDPEQKKTLVEEVKAIGNGALAGIVIAVILVVLIAIDLFCCFFNSCGLFFCCKQLLCKEKGATKASYAVKDATAMEKTKLAAENSNV
ncbi:neural cell adhesion molecule 1-like isoform X3 [Acropora palmata]|uniref:neural cell adhesion molecule 1-like isoform X3 n=1 Tax=Acropora palmata TaxID=6131 RepID=UPI003DA1BCF0